MVKEHCVMIILMLQRLKQLQIILVNNVNKVIVAKTVLGIFVIKEHSQIVLRQFVRVIQQKFVIQMAIAKVALRDTIRMKKTKIFVNIVHPVPGPMLKQQQLINVQPQNAEQDIIVKTELEQFVQ